jgi:hypothetical protein
LILVLEDGPRAVGRDPGVQALFGLCGSGRFGRIKLGQGLEVGAGRERRERAGGVGLMGIVLVVVVFECGE